MKSHVNILSSASLSHTCMCFYLCICLCVQFTVYWLFLSIHLRAKITISLYSASENWGFVLEAIGSYINSLSLTNFLISSLESLSESRSSVPYLLPQTLWSCRSSTGCNIRMTLFIAQPRPTNILFENSTVAILLNQASWLSQWQVISLERVPLSASSLIWIVF